MSLTVGWRQNSLSDSRSFAVFAAVFASLSNTYIDLPAVMRKVHDAARIFSAEFTAPDVTASTVSFVPRIIKQLSQKLRPDIG
jgi:hypothetical protein